ncbi:uncharacterized protein LOC129595615 [Paramacrobiotus metropolitanus]|uniref:uncharacterized protein LOC129595615 n=1 Tax=Paramacrobiotus metropolitanus TaxID=2943436 RepID=UPI002445FAA3|nr:uncharacterized protein LOC129595615 [Paramacrobiotus metropolitanus]
MDGDDAAHTKTLEKHEIIGSTCEYHYGNVDYIARGAFGVVFKATISKRGSFTGDKFVAIKVVHLPNQVEIFENTENYSRWRDRLRILIELKHDNIVTYHKISITEASGGATVELMMDYCNGDLALLMRRMRESQYQLEYATVLNYTTQITTGLEFLHEKSIIHGDLKPGNVLLKPTSGNATPSSLATDHRLVIGDLDDLVQMQQNVTGSKDISHFRGTTRYTSPEMLKKFAQIPTETPGRKTDIWSLGCIVLELTAWFLGDVTRKLCKGKDITNDVNKLSDSRFASLIMDGYVPLVSESIPANLAACIQACLIHDPKQRISAAEMLQQLRTPVCGSTQHILVYFYEIIRSKGSVSSQAGKQCFAHIFDPATSKMQHVGIPEDLQKRYISEDFGGRSIVATDTELLYNVITPSKVNVQNELVAWQVEKQIWQSTNLSSGCLMQHPVVLRDKVYFWCGNADELTFVKAEISTGHARKLARPGGERFTSVRCGVALKKSVLYILADDKAGMTRAMWLASFDTSFNNASGTWESLSYLPQPRRLFAMVTIDEDIYIVGGKLQELPDSTTPFMEKWPATGSCLRLNIKTRRWREIHSLIQPRWDHSACVINKRIYAFGGMTPDGKHAQTMEMYDTELSTGWSTVTVSMSQEVREQLLVVAKDPFRWATASAASRRE